MNSDWVGDPLTDLTDGVGPSLSGSPQLVIAVTQVAAAMRSQGAEVTLQAVKVPQRLHLTALGSSAATPGNGLTARVIVVHDFDEFPEPPPRFKISP